MLRTYGLHREMAWFDEMPCLSNLDEPTLYDHIAAVREYDSAMLPLYATLTYGLAQVTGDSAYPMRLVSVVCGLASILMIFFLARGRFGPTAGLFAAGCLALSTTHIYFSQEIRVYAMTFALALGSAITFLRVLHGGCPRWWVAHIVLSGLLLWSHMFACFVPVAQGLTLLAIRWRTPKVPLLWGLLHVPILLPLIWWVTTINFGTIDSAHEWIPVPSLWTLYRYALLYTGTRTTEVLDLGTLMPGGVSAEPFIVVIMLALAATAFVSVARKRFAQEAGEADGDALRRWEDIVFLVLWCVLPILVLFVLSRVWRPCLVGRYTLHAAVPFLVLVAGGVATLRPARQLLVALLLIPLCLYQFFAIPGPFRVDWPTTIRAMENLGATQGDAVFSLTVPLRDPIWYYAGTMDPVPSIGHAEWVDYAELPDKVKSALADGRTSWVFVPAGYDMGPLEDVLNNQRQPYAYALLDSGYRQVGFFHIKAHD
jgi:4-amino-4-deoxy-L-arabinose transferase-like glycosyltransferase